MQDIIQKLNQIQIIVKNQMLIQTTLQYLNLMQEIIHKLNPIQIII